MFINSFYVLKIAIGAALVVLFFGLLFSYEKKSTKRHSKNLSRFDTYKEMNEDEILKRIKNQDAYSEKFKKTGFKYVKNNAQLTANLITSLKIDLNQYDLILARADENEISAEELAIKKIVGMFVALAFGLIGVIFDYLFIVVAVLAYMYFAILPINQLNKKHKVKASNFREVMPSYIRLVANATGVGNSIEEALKKVGDKYPCVITDEINKASAEAEYSNDWVQGLLNASYNADISEFEQLVSEIRISKEKGTSITEVLLKLAEKVEKENAYEAEAIARSKATTIILPVFLFLFAPMLAGVLLPVGTIVIGMI